MYDEEDEEYFIFAGRGIQLEPLAFDKFAELKDFDFLEVEKCGSFNYNDYSSASPDGLVSDNSILEIKCPRREKFFKIISKGTEIVDKNYIYQMQFQMMCTQREKAYFFNYYLDRGFEMWHELEFYPDNKIMKLIDERLLMFYEKREDYINQIKQNMQFAF